MALPEEDLTETPAPKCLLEVGAPKALLQWANVSSPIDKQEADTLPGTDGTSPRMRMPLKGETAELLAKNASSFEGEWYANWGLWI